MISNLVGSILKKNTKTKVWWLKLGIALFLSNVFFSVLFSGEEKSVPQITSEIPQGWIEVQIRADLMTPFQDGKKILLMQRARRQLVEGKLKNPSDAEGRITILVRESEAQALFHHQEWEVLPYISNMKFPSVGHAPLHEIKY